METNGWDGFPDTETEKWAITMAHDFELKNVGSVALIIGVIVLGVGLYGIYFNM